MAVITYDQIMEAISVVEDLQKQVSAKKYQLPGESCFSDVIARVVTETAPHYKPVYEELVPFSKVENMLATGRFIPAGSILSGLGNNQIKCSLSNCYVTPFEHDSIEGIFDGLKKAARTYSYRGGTGMDVTILRPKDEPVNNAARSSSGAVSFMPLMSEVTNSIGQSGRRGALMASIDIRHPDAMRFIWCKSRPEEVFGKDFLTGKLPDVYGANISLKLTDSFMKAVIEKEDWEFVFPDREADTSLYDTKWNGSYEDWWDLGGKLKSYGKLPAAEIMAEIAKAAHFSGDPGVLFIDTVQLRTPGADIHPSLKPITTNPCFSEDTLIATSEGPRRIKELVGETVTVFDGENWVECDNFRVTGTEQKLLRIGLSDGAHLDVTPYHNMYLDSGEKLQAKELAAGMLLEHVGSITEYNATVSSITELSGEHTVYCCTIPTTHKVLTAQGVVTGQCGEQALSAYNNCLLGAVVLSKYVDFPFTDAARFNESLFLEDIKGAVTFMNTLSDINVDLHPLEEQRKADKFGKRIGIEFTALGDTLAMLGYKYGQPGAIEFTSRILKLKAHKEIECSMLIAKKGGYAPALADISARRGFLNNEYVKDLELPDDLRADIMAYGMANTAFNTVGPTGSISIISNNCTSGIEPLFMFSYARQTRLDPNKYFHMMHKPALDFLLENFSKEELVEGIDLDRLKTILGYVEAWEVDWRDRLKMQDAVQRVTDSCISSTVNLPETATTDEIVDIYITAWQSGLKGVTVFRDGCKKGVLVSTETANNDGATTPEPDRQPAVTLTTPYIQELLDEERSVRHRVQWKGSKIYIIVTLNDEDEPLEVFAKLPREAGINGNGMYSEEHFQEKYSLWETVTRLVSLLLRSGMPVEKIIDQLEKSAYSIVDASAILCRILRKYLPSLLEDSELTDAEIVAQELGKSCPECGKKAYVFEGGCGACRNCGYTTCG